MLAWLRENLKKRDIQRINKGASEVIDYSRQCLRPETMRRAAVLTREHLERVGKIYGGDPIGPKRALVEYKNFHTEARRQRDDAALTAFTLVALYIRAETQGSGCRPGQKAIDDFVAEWAHVEEDQTRAAL